MPKRKAYLIQRAKNVAKTREKNEIQPDIYMPKSESENKISSAGDTQKLIANFPCPKCLKFGLKTLCENVNLFQSKVEVYCETCGLVNTLMKNLQKRGKKTILAFMSKISQTRTLFPISTPRRRKAFSCGNRTI